MKKNNLRLNISYKIIRGLLVTSLVLYVYYYSWVLLYP